MEEDNGNTQAYNNPVSKVLRRAHNSPSISIPRNNVKSKTFGNSDAANLLPPNLEYLARLAFFCLL